MHSPCLFVSASCDCPGCREHRRRGLERALMAEERARDGLVFDEAAGIVRAEEEGPRLSPAEATARLKRRKGEPTFADFWQGLEAAKRAHAEDIEETKACAERCGFRARYSVDRKSARGTWRASVWDPYLLSACGDVVLAYERGTELRERMEACWAKAVELSAELQAEQQREREETEAVAKECGFELIGLVRGKWRACPLAERDTAEPALLEASSAERLCKAMRKAAKQARALVATTKGRRVRTKLPEDLKAAAYLATATPRGSA